MRALRVQVVTHCGKGRGYEIEMSWNAVPRFRANGSTEKMDQNEAHTQEREKNKRTVKEHLIDAMVLSSTSRKAIICTCAWLLEMATSKSEMSGDVSKLCSSKRQGEREGM